ncbi:CapA family protein [Alkalihalobacillus sp. AL-G]|uniref:CapA family protein n=1 Tax=Alkalihalobacillus sp. AL-G TaxID=2926399 RepID=UPI00272D2206|nr:CapA family protein [Alkalihalobacillus sp. AL-G]WLD92670.1 CapA family protein [Alkalihalobacillus sp. AL-G]
MKKVTVISLLVVSFILFFMLFLSIGLSGTILNNSNDTEPQAKTEQPTPDPPQEPPPVQPPPAEKTTTVELMAIGDILIHDTVYNTALTDSNQYDFTPMFENVKPYLQSADITMANQETMIGGTEIGVSTYPTFNSPYEVGDALKSVGVDIVTIANNHTLDRGEKAIINAIDHWDTIDMKYTGAYRSSEDRSTIRVIEKNDIVFSFLSYTYGTNGIPVPDGKPYLVNLIELDIIKSDIKKANEKSDVVVVSLHFGDEYERLPNDEQKLVANEVALAGADIIIGHHPHVLQPPAWIDRADGSRTFVAYSLGNFLSGQRWDYKDIGGIMQIEIEKHVKGEFETITLKNPSFLPTWVDRDFIVHPLVNLPDKQSMYTEIKTHMSKWIPDIHYIDDQKQR